MGGGGGIMRQTIPRGGVSVDVIGRPIITALSSKSHGVRNKKHDVLLLASEVDFLPSCGPSTTFHLPQFRIRDAVLEHSLLISSEREHCSRRSRCSERND